MNHLHLILKFRLAGDDHWQIKEAARIKVDGRGGLSFYDVQNGSTERLEVERLRSFSLLSIAPLCGPAMTQGSTLIH